MKVTFIPIVVAVLGTVTERLLKGLENLEIRWCVETIQTTTTILRRVLENWGNLLSLKLQWKTISQRLCEKLSRNKIMIYVRVCVCVWQWTTSYILRFELFIKNMWKGLVNHYPNMGDLTSAPDCVLVSTFFFISVTLFLSCQHLQRSSGSNTINSLFFLRS